MQEEIARRWRPVASARSGQFRRRPAIEPRGESVSNTELFRRLARALGRTEAWLFESDESMLRAALASGDPVPGKAVRTTIDPDIQSAAVSALGGTFGGVAVLDARSGDVLGVAGLAFSEPGENLRTPDF